MAEDATASPDSMQLRLDGYEGPLELLLELARGQPVDLARISIVSLVDQFVTAVAAMQRRDLARATEWLVMAAWLTWLKSRLMLPQELEEAKQGSEAGQVLIDRLAELDRIRSISTWLEAQPQLGRDMFERGSRLHPNGAGRGGTTWPVCSRLASVFFRHRNTASRMSIYRPRLPLLDASPSSPQAACNA